MDAYTTERGVMPLGTGRPMMSCMVHQAEVSSPLRPPPPITRRGLSDMDTAPPSTRELWNPPHYLRQVQAKVRRLQADGVREFIDICRSAEGAFPSLLLNYVPTKPASTVSYRDDRRPFPSPVRGEWYFTDDSAERIAHRLGSHPLLLGTPSVAQFSTGYTLVDSSPWIYRRFDRIQPSRHMASSLEAIDALPHADSAILDPPWYGNSMQYWLSRASEVVSVGGPIMLPLLGGLTRPSAAADREQTIEYMRAIGEVEIVPSAVEYATPLFEERALAAAGLSLPRPWRVADLAIVRNESPAQRLSADNDDQPTWVEYRIGDELLGVRPAQCAENNSSHRESAHFRITHITTPDSVSRRHPAISQADIWSSSNRIARVDNLPAVHTLLRNVSGESGCTHEHRSALGELAALFEGVDLC